MPVSPVSKEGDAPIPSLHTLSLQQRLRLSTPVSLPRSLALGSPALVPVGAATTSVGDSGDIARLFPCLFGKEEVRVGEIGKVREGLRVAVVLSGGQAAGGHNVIAGLYDRITQNKGQVFGFVNGPHGVFSGEYVELTDARVAAFRNQGGFHMIGSGRHKIETPEQFEASLEVAEALSLDGLVVIGGDDSNTNAAVLAEYFASKGSKCSVVGCPKTIDGDLKCDAIECSFGFDTACMTFSELIGNIALDGASSRKYHNFVRLMGRSASHITLECALQTAPNLCLVGEEIEALGMTLEQITAQICDLIVERWEAGRDYSLVIMPEGLVEFVPEMRALISELNDILAEGDAPAPDGIAAKLSERSREVFGFLPDSIRAQLLLERDPHGNVQVSRIETEKLLILLCGTELARRKEAGVYGGDFRALGHFFGYEGRSGLPSRFDSEYCYALGATASLLVAQGHTGYIASIRGLKGKTEDWEVGGVPLTSLMNLEKRKGKMKPVIRKALVELDGGPFKVFAGVRDSWRLGDRYRNPGPIQFHGPAANARTFLLRYERGDAAHPVHDPSHPSWNAASAAGAQIERGSGAALAQDFSPIRDAAQLSELQRSRAALSLPTCAAAVADPVRTTVRSSASGAPGAPGASSSSADLSADDAPVRALFPEVSDLPVLEIASAVGDGEEPAAKRPAPAALRVGVAFMGRQCPGGHTVVDAIHSHLASSRPGSTVLGFLGGSRGMRSGNTVVVDEPLLALYRNQGGYDMLGRTSDSLDEEGCAEAVATAARLELDGIVLVGGAKTVPVALALSAAMRKARSATRVALVPATVDGDLSKEWIECPIGFDTACSTYSTVIGNIGADAASAKKYYYFIRLMGRQSSHVTAECALRTHPNFAVLGEEVRAQALSLDAVTARLADMVCERAEAGKNYGLVLIPEGLVSLFPEIAALVDAIRELGTGHTDASAAKKLPAWLSSLFTSLPVSIRTQLLLARDSEGSLELSHIDTEKLLLHTVGAELERRRAVGRYSGKFSAIPTFFGYQGRCALPSRFDCSLARTLGAAAVATIAAGHSGYAATASGLARADPRDWTVRAVPLTRLVRVSSSPSSVVTKADFPVDLHGAAVRSLAAQRGQWYLGDEYANPGPPQFFGPMDDGGEDGPAAEAEAISAAERAVAAGGDRESERGARDGRAASHPEDPLYAARCETLQARTAGTSAVFTEIADLARSIEHLAGGADADGIVGAMTTARDRLREVAADLSRAVRDARAPLHPMSPTKPMLH